MREKEEITGDIEKKRGYKRAGEKEKKSGNKKRRIYNTYWMPKECLSICCALA